MCGLFEKNFSTLVCDDGKKKVFSQILGIVGCELYPKGGKFEFRIYDEESNRYLIEVKTTKKKYRKLEKKLTKQFPEVCQFNFN